jgi:transcription antitermination protein NusB
MGSRRKGRVIAFQALFSWDALEPGIDELLEFRWIEDERREKLGDDIITFARFIVSGTVENIKKIDKAIENQAENWDFSRISKVDLAILRISVYAILFQSDIPYTVTINEAVEMSKKYGSGESFKFVNGILDGIQKKRSNI